MKPAPASTRLLELYRALPEPYQPAWGIDGTAGLARRACDDRFAAILPVLEALPAKGRLRVLDIGCAQGYFALALAQAMRERGRDVEIVGIDDLPDNIRFCKALAAHHRLAVDFVQRRFDAGFFEGLEYPDFDVVLALNVLHHLSHRDGADGAAAGLRQIRKHARVLFCELAQPAETLAWVDEWNADDDTLLGGWAFHRRIGRFATHLGELRRPLYVCSDRAAWVGGAWFPFERIADRSHAGVPGAFAGQRRFLSGSGILVKAFRGDGRHGAFNRKELHAEAEVLAALPNDPGRYPELLATEDDGDTLWLVRRALPGEQVSVLLGGRRKLDADAIVRGLLAELARLESLGFQHADLRWWNVLLQGTEVRLIDFGAVVREASPLHRVALAALLPELAHRELVLEQPYYASLHPLSAFPLAWRPLARYLLETPVAAFRYSDALALFTGSGKRDRAAATAPLAPDDGVLAAVQTEQRGSFQRLHEYADDANRHLQSADAALRAALEAERNAAQAEISRLHAHAQDLETHVADAQHGFEQATKHAKEAAVHAGALEDALRVSQAYADSLKARLEHETADAIAERAALLAEQEDREKHAKSLARALKESQSYVDALKAHMAREAADANAERAALLAARDDCEKHAASLAHALEESQTYTDSLQARIQREADDANAERTALLAARQDSAQHAKSLARALEESQTYVDSLKTALDAAQTHAALLEARVEREAADARKEKAALLAANRDAEAYSGMLQRALEDSRGQIAALQGSLQELESRHLRMQRRFRWLKPWWPREQGNDGIR